MKKSVGGRYVEHAGDPGSLVGRLECDPPPHADWRSDWSTCCARRRSAVSKPSAKST